MKILLSVLLSLSLVACHKGTYDTQKQSSFQFDGIIKAQQMTTYQAGQYIIMGVSRMYRVQSSSIDISKYVDKHVTVYGNIIGVGIDSSPEIIDAINISLTK
jgi:hypothetical protein